MQSSFCSALIYLSGCSVARSVTANTTTASFDHSVVQKLTSFSYWHFLLSFFNAPCTLPAQPTDVFFSLVYRNFSSGRTLCSLSLFDCAAFYGPYFRLNTVHSLCFCQKWKTNKKKPQHQTSRTQTKRLFHPDSAHRVTPRLLNQVILSIDWMCIHYRTKTVKNWCRQMCWHLTFVFWTDLWESCLSGFFIF